MRNSVNQVGVIACLILLLAAALVASTKSLTLAGATIAFLVLGLAWVLLKDRLAWAVLGTAFAVAPAYLVNPLGGPSTLQPATALTGLALFLLIPRIFSTRARLDPYYLVGVLFILALGVVATARSSAPAVSTGVLISWAICLLVPLAITRAEPPTSLLDRLAWCYVLGQVASTVLGLLTGAAKLGRYTGLTPHPNYFGMSGALSVALLLHLLARRSYRSLVLLALGVCMLSVYLSGSRAAALATVLVFLLVPLVERRVSSVIAVTVLGALSVTAAVVALMTGSQNDGTALGRLAGGGYAADSDTVRANALSQGWDRFLEHPLLGSGFIDLFSIHNVYVEIAVSIGAFGLAAYIALVARLAWPLVGNAATRRLSYPVVAGSLIAATEPNLVDLAMWLVFSLACVAMHQEAATRRATGRLGQVPLTAPDR